MRVPNINTDINTEGKLVSITLWFTRDQLVDSLGPRAHRSYIRDRYQKDLDEFGVDKLSISQRAFLAWAALLEEESKTAPVRITVGSVSEELSYEVALDTIKTHPDSFLSGLVRQELEARNPKPDTEPEPQTEDPA